MAAIMAGSKYWWWLWDNPPSPQKGENSAALVGLLNSVISVVNW